MTSTYLPRPSLLTQSEPFRRSLAGKVTLALAASAFVALCAHVSVPMPVTPVPTTLQTFAVVLVGMTLGPVEGFAALALYLAEGAAGLPVFSPQGPGGIFQLLGVTAGYLFAYPIAAGVAGLVVRGARKLIGDFPAALVAGVAGLLPIFAMGTWWLAHVHHLGGTRAFALGTSPFLAAEAIKLLAAAAAYAATRQVARR